MGVDLSEFLSVAEFEIYLWGVYKYVLRDMSQIIYEG